MPDTITPASLPTVSAPLAGDMMTNPQMFEHMQRLAKVFCASSLIPEHLKRNNGADALLALQIARERGENPVTVMQSIYFVSGKAGWAATYMIARANKSGVFKGPIRWRSEGAGETLSVTAVAKMSDTGEEVSAEVSMAMAKAEGWTKNSKYSTMPIHMLRYRSATMLVRLFCPEVLIGMQTVDELEDMHAAGQIRDVTGEGHATTAESVGAILGAPAQKAAQEPEAPAADGEVLPPEQAVAEAAVNWQVNAVGEAAIIKGIKELIDVAPRESDVQAVLGQNAEKIGKMSAMKRDDIQQHAESRMAWLKEAA